MIALPNIGNIQCDFRIESDNVRVTKGRRMLNTFTCLPGLHFFNPDSAMFLSLISNCQELVNFLLLLL